MNPKNVNNDAEFMSVFDALNLGHPEALPPQTQRPSSSFTQVSCDQTPYEPCMFSSNHLPCHGPINNPAEGRDEVDLDGKIVIELMSNPVSLHLVACDYKDSLVLRETIKKNKTSSFLMGAITWTLALEFVHIACNKSGMRVIKDCFEELSPADNKPLCEQMTEHYFELATDQLGCLLLNDCMPYMGSFYMDSIFRKIVTDCQFLAQHRYGTYVVQNAIRVQHPEYTLPIVENLRSIILRLATQKEGSHLVEKCLLYSSTKKIVMEELNNLNSVQLRYLSSRAFGNYVIQKAFMPSIDGESQEVLRLTFLLNRALHELQNDLPWHPNGRNLYRKRMQLGCMGRYKPQM